MQQQTSRDAYMQYKRGGQAMRQDYDRIISCLEINPNGFTRNEVAKITGIPINRITGRINELLEDDVLKTEGRRQSQTTGYIGEIIKLNKPKQ